MLFPADLLTGTRKQNQKNLVPCGTDGRLLFSGVQALVTLTLTLDRVIGHTVRDRRASLGKTSFSTD